MALALLAFLGVLFSISSRSLKASFQRMEADDTTKNVQRVTEAVRATLGKTSELAGDWAGWDDSYAFIKDGNRGFYSNLGVNGISGLSVNLLVFIQPSGSILYATGFDLKNSKKTPLPDDFRQILKTQPSLWRHTNTKSVKSGLLLLSTGPMLTVSRPILTSEKNGPIRGTLIFGRYLDEIEIKSIAERTRLSVSLQNVDEKLLPPGVERAAKPLSVTDSFPAQSVHIQPLNKETIAGYTLLKDIKGRPAALLKVSMPRDIHRQGQRAVYFLMVSGLFSGLLFGALTLLMLERGVLSPLTRLSQSLASIRASSDASARVKVRGQDELSLLARDVNSTLEALEQSQSKLRKAHDELEERVAERTNELTQLNLELRLANEEAERAGGASNAKSEFLSRMSHELRTPMNSILGFAQILEMEDMNASQKESVGYILRGGQHLLGLINEVLDIARIEAGHISLSPEPVAVHEVIEECLSLIRPLALKNNIQLNNQAKLPLELYVRVDLQRLKQVLINLLSNAVKYNREGGQVDIICLVTAEGKGQIQVKDTGHGISPEALKRLFIPFDRLGAERLGVEGTGLGLTLAKDLVEAMDGTLTVESVEGSGSTFSVELPLAECGAAEPQSAPGRTLDEEQSSESIRSFTVLSIEDNASNYRLIEAIIESRPGVKLIGAIQGSIGMDMARQHHPDLILLDLHLPDIMGWDVLHRLREDPGTRDIPIVILSADATQSQIDRLLVAGANAYLTKPLDLKAFLHVLDEAAHKNYSETT